MKSSGLENLYIVPSDIELAETEQNITGRTVLEKILKKALKSFEEYFDYVFIDCPPQLGFLTTNAFVATDEAVDKLNSQEEQELNKSKQVVKAIAGRGRKKAD